MEEDEESVFVAEWFFVLKTTKEGLLIVLCQITTYLILYSVTKKYSRNRGERGHEILNGLREGGGQLRV